MTEAAVGHSHRVLGVVLAGGQARRMGGGDKCLRILGGRTLLARLIDIARPQVAALILNANGDPDRFAEFGLPVAADVIEGHAGPLAGVLTGMRAAGSGTDWIATFPSDAPFLPADLVARLRQAAHEAGADIACASSAGRSHPVAALWRVALADDLEHAMREEDMRKIDAWTARHRLVQVDWPTDPVDPFFNANRPNDLAEAEALLHRL